jgi:uncharacterized membrane protein YgaE (UPF0421/DUF939 family)
LVRLGEGLALAYSVVVVVLGGVVEVWVLGWFVWLLHGSVIIVVAVLVEADVDVVVNAALASLKKELEKMEKLRKTAMVELLVM